MTEPLLQLRKLTVHQNRQLLLDQIDLSLKAGEIMTIIGPNGAGKTTLIKAALGLIKADAGEVFRARGLRIGYMPQRLSVNPLMPISVERFLAMASADPANIDRVLVQTDISHLRHSPLHDISGGETQRVLLSRALLRRPQLLVLDEPGQGLDITGQTELYELIGELRNTLGCAVLMVSHDLHWVMAQTDTVICLNQHVCCHGHPEQVSNDPAYLSLFGRRHAEALALYQHHHDHRHDIHGDVICDHAHHD